MKRAISLLFIILLINTQTILGQTNYFNNTKFRNIGPTIMSGRVVDLEVNPHNPINFIVAYASGGVWQTKNNGIRFEVISDNLPAISFGDIAVNWNDSTIWVGTGENNSSRSSYYGTGIYKSTDLGKSWQSAGLENTQHIGRIVLHPQNPETLWVASLGNLYTKDENRGIYKTTDGGKNWTKTLFISDSVGVIDLVIDAKNPNILYASSWERDRKAWHFKGSGKGSAIYKSIDGGNKWEKISSSKNGFIDGEGVGRIGLAIVDENTVYAVVDNQNSRNPESKNNDNLTKDELRNMTKEIFLGLKDEKITTFLKENHFPKKYSLETIKEKVKNNTIAPIDLVKFIENANAKLFDVPVIGAEVYVTNDGGKTWKKQNNEYIDDLYYSYGYYFGQIRVAPYNPQIIYLLGVPAIQSKDGGKTWKSINQDNVHLDHHALWINPNLEGHLILGNDGGINITYDDGKSYFKANNIPVGQFYFIEYDLEKNYNVYGGLQDNGVWFGKNSYSWSDEWHQEGVYPYKNIMGGDGMQVMVDKRDNTTVYTGYQFGNYYRINKNSMETQYITPSHELGEYPFRWNWQAPILLSQHHNDVLYMGSNKFHRSFDKGENFEPPSQDLTQGEKKGNIPFGTLTTIAESPFKFGLLYAGSDDGLIHISKDGGYTWKKISEGLPQNLWVSRLVASAFKEERVYVSLNGYRNDDFKPYLFVSEDYGKTWKSIIANLPNQSINVVKEDPKNENILYVGTDGGVFVSINMGDNYMKINDLPMVAVHDLLIQPEKNDLIVGTHGRSIYVINVEKWQLLNKDILNKSLHIFEIEKIKWNENWGKASWSKWNEPRKHTFPFFWFLKDEKEITVDIYTASNIHLFSEKQNKTYGLIQWDYDLHIDPSKIANIEKQKTKNKEVFALKKADNNNYYLPKGKYKIILTVDNQKVEKYFEVVE